MRHYTETSRIYEGTTMSFIFIEGTMDSGANEYIRQNIERIRQLFDGECEFRTIVPAMPEDATTRELVLRLYPAIGKHELEDKVKAIQNSYSVKSHSRLLYINDTRYDVNGEFEADIVCEDEFGNEFRQKLELFLEEVQRCRHELFCFATPGLGSYRYKLGESVEAERDELLESDNIECLCQDLMAESICGTCDATEEISPLRFDKDFNISLPLYPQIIITLDPLPKALYILFLQHPEGILLKDIQEYELELKEIYSMVSGRKNPTVIERMFRSLIDPSENPLHKNISIIRRSFTSKLNYNIAKNYIPAHGRAKVHNIPLDTHLVEFAQLA